MFGLKGYIDATVQFRIQHGLKQSTILTPFEFKTGKRASSAHEAQTALYTLMLSDRYGKIHTKSHSVDLDVSTGTLFYLIGSKLKMIPKLAHHVRSLIMGRNLVAHYMASTGQLPPMLKNRKYTCQNCYALDTCLLYHKVLQFTNVE